MGLTYLMMLFAKGIAGKSMTKRELLIKNNFKTMKGKDVSDKCKLIKSRVHHFGIRQGRI